MTHVTTQGDQPHKGPFDRGHLNASAAQQTSKNLVGFIHFTKDQIFRFVFSPDGTKLAIERGGQEADAVLFHDTTK